MSEALRVSKSKPQAVELEGTEDPCHICAPLGASLVFAGLERGMTILHGSQGCATYVRRYLISHFREPIDIASSSFVETTTIFGGKENLENAIRNLVRQYSPSFIGVATTCIAETMGEDIEAVVRGASRDYDPLVLIPVSTPGFKANHREGFQLAQSALVKAFTRESPGDVSDDEVVVFPGFVSPEDIRWLKGIFREMNIRTAIVPDYSASLDGGPWEEYRNLPEGGTTLAQLEDMRQAAGSIEIGSLPLFEPSPGTLLAEKAYVPCESVSMPIGIELTDAFFESIYRIVGRKTPGSILETRARLADAYIDAHKYVFGKRVLVYGDEDMVVALAVFLTEIGMIPLVCASGGATGYLKSGIETLITARNPAHFGGERIHVLPGADFREIENVAGGLDLDIMIGNSKGYKIAKKIDLPLFRCGFPIHDRFGGQRILHCGYEGTLNLLDGIVNTLIGMRQEENPVGYTYY